MGIRDIIKRKIQELGENIWQLISFSGTLFFVLYLFPQIREIKDFYTIFALILGAIILAIVLITIFELLGEGMKFISDKFVFYMANIKEIEQLKKDVAQLKIQLEKIKEEKRK